ncbi:Uncharacterized protein SCF082_LOCUS428 [Durusdinium trenchii]|uniref:Uncharacterized protein n=1 Tax=Durusdinium trenchii TaxID=1381693 RepID=A0ABP0H9E3_9DINO
MTLRVEACSSAVPARPAKRSRPSFANSEEEEISDDGAPSAMPIQRNIQKNSLPVPPMAVPSVEGFARWNLQRCPEVLEAIRAKFQHQRRPVRVFSMYTGWGTAEMVAHAVKGELERVGVKLQIEVAWICESNRDKCNYLAHAFKDVPYIFTDASEVATGCAYDFLSGRRLLAPLDLDMGFVGYPCVDLSSLNIGQSKFMDANTATGKGYANMLKLVDLCDQLVFLGVENSGNMWRKRKQDQFHRPIEIQDRAFRQRNFAACSHCVSSHEFGPPQSRRRSWSLYFKSAHADEADASNIFLSFKCALMPIEQILQTEPEQPRMSRAATGQRQAKWQKQFEELSKSLDQARLGAKLREVTARNLKLTARELHVVALAAYQLESRGVDLEERQVEPWL